MGVDLADLILRQKITLDDLSGKKIAIDMYNALYQFLTIIRGKSGEPLMDREGRVTSHLSGLFYRVTNLSEKGIRVVCVFDGKPPSLKEDEIRRRFQRKADAQVKYEKALKRGDLEEARVQVQATSRISDSMVEDSRRLLDVLGIPWMVAPSEGEAQAAYIASRGDVWAASSQDYDSLLFGAPRLVRNLSISGRRKLPRRNAYIEVEPEIVELSHVLQQLQITREQLVDLGILLGTDYNPDGVKGIGPKTALKMLKQSKSLDNIAPIIEGTFPENYGKIQEMFLHPDVTSSYELEWKNPDVDATTQFLCSERDFSEDRVRNALGRMITGLRKTEKRTTLESFFR
ncbi:MAG: flap endonuclease-1 [archaeon]